MQSVFIQFALLSLTCLVSIGVTLIATRLGHRYGAVDRPGGRRTHKAPTPHLGGVAVYLTLWIVVGGAMGIIWLQRLTGALDFLPGFVQALVRDVRPAELRLLAIFGGGTAVLLLGLLADLRDLSTPLRLLVQIGAAIAVVAAGVRPQALSLPSFAALPIAVLWIVGMTNAFNFLDGIDGLCAGLAAIASGILAVYLATSTQPIAALFLIAFTGALLGFLRWNFPPARIFLGNAGSMFCGFILGVMTLESARRTLAPDTILPALLPLLLLGIPLYDAVTVIAGRLLRGQSPFKADRNHVHHRLRSLGLSDRQTVCALYLLGTALGVNAILIERLDNLGGFVLLVQLTLMFCAIALIEFGLLGQRDALAATKPTEVEPAEEVAP
ncbi:MAG: glycosyltransferase family 4 protein [Planctomycetota bacterium]|jgi:UDP-GlcNAc:undecaprenyl-phosphate GlcNAc-1-phosphate transferase